MSAFQYESSRVFSSLKNLKERIPGNMTTFQYLISYDQMLDNATRPVLDNTNFLDGFVIRALGWQCRNFRRKISFLPRADVPSRVMNFLAASTPESRMKRFQSIRFERGLRVEFLETFLASMGQYEQACDLSLEDPNGEDPLAYCLWVKTSTEENLGCPSDLISTIREVRYWLSIAASFKEKLLEKYIRLCLNSAQKDYVSFFDCSVDLSDLVQTYVMTASRAIDKCDYRQGVLTSHIQKWMFTARECASRQRMRTDTDFDSLTFQEISDKELVESFYTSDQETVNVISRLARLVDPNGAARCYLQLPEPTE